MKKNVLKVISSVLTICLVLVLIPTFKVNAKTTNEKDLTKPLTWDMLSDEEKEDFELVNTEKKFMKASLDKQKSRNAMEQPNVIYEEISESEYILATSQNKNLRISFPGFDNPSEDTYNNHWIVDGYFTLITEAYRSYYNNSQFMVVNTFLWEQLPTFKLIDLVGVGLSDGMHINMTELAKYNTKSETHYMAWDGSVKTVQNELVYDRNSKGIAAKVDLSKSSAPHFMAEGYLKCYPKFSAETPEISRTGTLTGYYNHYQIKVGNEVSFDNEGKPSFMLEPASDEFDVPVAIQTRGPM